MNRGHDKPSTPPTVAHLGPVADSPGGIAQVARSMVSWPGTARRQEVIVTTRGGGAASDLRLVPAAIAAVIRSRRAGALLLHVHFSQRGSFVREGFYTFLARAARVPVVAQIHGSGFADFAQRHPWLIAKVLNRTSAVVCLTQETEDVLRHLIRGTTQIERTFNAVADPGPSTPPTRQFVFGGVVSRRKGADVLIQAWRRIEQQAVDGEWQLVICGPPSDDIDLAEVRDLRNVEVRGSLPHEEMMELLTSAASVVLPSRAEAFPMFLVEGMVRGAVPISTDVGDVCRLIGDAGYCLPIADVAALADAMGHVMTLSTDQLLVRRVQARDRILQKFDLPSAARDMERIWSDAIS